MSLMSQMAHIASLSDEDYNKWFIENWKRSKQNPMNNAPGNPTENPIEARITELRFEVLTANESIKTQEHIIWLAKVEIERKKKAIKAAISSIESLEKGPES